MAISNRSVLHESPGLATPGKGRFDGGIMATAKSAIDDQSFLGSQLGGGDDPRQAYSKIRERLMELEIEKEEQEK